MSWVWVAWLVVLGLTALASEDIWRDAIQRELSYGETALAPFDLVYPPVRGYLVATLVVVSLWLHRSRRFAEAHDTGHRFRLSIGWTWFGWVVPLLMLWFPALAVADVWRATLRVRAPWFFVPWWCCWLATLWLCWTAEGWLGGFLGFDVLRDRALVVGEAYLIGSVLAGLACWAWTTMVVRIRRGQLGLTAAQFVGPTPSTPQDADIRSA